MCVGARVCVCNNSVRVLVHAPVPFSVLLLIKIGFEFSNNTNADVMRLALLFVAEDHHFRFSRASGSHRVADIQR
jgi:hypothetical protein